MSSPKIQANKVALVTGGARRIGAAIVKMLHTADYNVIIHYHQSKTTAQSLRDELNRQRLNSACILQGDLKKISTLDLLIQKALSWQNRLDVLVNNASIFKSSHLTFNSEDWQELFTVNVQAPFYLSLLASTYLKSQQGNIINITDIHAQKPLKGYSVYCQTKAALIMQTLSLAKELAPQIRVNAISPGAICWPEGENALSKEIQQKIIESTPLKQGGNPINIAKAALFLAENSFVTGQVIAVDGGRSL